MKKAALVALVLATSIKLAVAQGQQPLDCPGMASSEADGTLYGYNGGLGEQFTLQLERSRPGDRKTTHVTCSAQDDEAKEVGCSIKGFSGIMHMNVAGTDSYFRIVGAPEIQVTVRPGQTMKCTIQVSNSSN
jgi:hypothetical protein